MTVRLALIAFSLASSLAGCDYSETSSDVREKYVDRHRDTFVFEGASRDHVTTPLRELLDEQGFPLLETLPNAATFHTKRRAARDGSSEEYAVHFIQLHQRPAFTVQLVKISRDPKGEVSSSYRDEKLEWELIQRADPDRALSIMASANERADKVPPKTRK
jgi:hypothetical protein